MKTWIISDTHGREQELDVPEVDMVIHAGDAGQNRSPVINKNQVLDFFAWYHSLNIKYKIYVPGNHDTSLEAGLINLGDIPSSIIFLNHQATEIEGMKFFGSPYTPKFGTGWAYNSSKKELQELWKDIPKNTDILITHGPPKGVLDLTQYDTRPNADGTAFFQCGCAELLKTVKRIKPKLHIFGHIHDETECPNPGILKITGLETTFINACVLNLRYELANNGIILDL